MDANFVAMEHRMQMDLCISEEEIHRKLGDVARSLDLVYQGKELVIVMVMKGSICLVADLLRLLQVPCSIEWVQAKSYGARGASRGELSILGLEELPIQGKHVLLVDDIYDSGHTLNTIRLHLQEKRPESLKTLVLLSKQVPKENNYQPDYVLFPIEDRFVVGYGLDYKELYRGLSGIYALIFE